MKDKYLALAFLGFLALGCHASDGDSESGDEGCDYRDREVGLDARFGNETPREVIALLERPADGPATWFSGKGEYVDVSGTSGSTQFHVEVEAGPTIWVHEGDPGMGGVQQSRLFCPTQFFFDVNVRLATSDGALAEDGWSGRATYDVSGELGGVGSITVMVTDPRPFSGTLTVTEHPDVADNWEVHELVIQLFFITSPLDFVGMHGRMTYNLQNLRDGDGELVTVTIAEFALPPG